MTSTKSSANRLAVAGLFAGIGGIERGLEQAGHHAELLVEKAPAAHHVLRVRFPDVKLEEDVLLLPAIPRGVDLVAAGFPCQDLSSVGPKAGIDGEKSGLVRRVFELLEGNPVPWVLLENVPFILQLNGGEALELIADSFRRLGYSWAYRVVDSQAFGLPQRRRRWYLVASRASDPRGVLLTGSTTPPPPGAHREVACGWYWTEGMRALGWAIDAVPPLKGGSSVGVPSPPAILTPGGFVGTPDIRDAERLQGLPVNWTKSAEDVVRPGFRWQLVGNAVNVAAAEWLGKRLARPPAYSDHSDQSIGRPKKWPYAAWGTLDGEVFKSTASFWPEWRPRKHLLDFLRYPMRPLSAKAGAGFLGRTRKGSLRFPDGFLEAVDEHVARQGGRK